MLQLKINKLFFFKRGEKDKHKWEKKKAWPTRNFASHPFLPAEAGSVVTRTFPFKTRYQPAKVKTSPLSIISQKDMFIKEN